MSTPASAPDSTQHNASGDTAPADRPTLTEHRYGAGLPDGSAIVPARLFLDENRRPVGDHEVLIPGAGPFDPPTWMPWEHAVAVLGVCACGGSGYVGPAPDGNKSGSLDACELCPNGQHRADTRGGHYLWKDAYRANRRY